MKAMRPEHYLCHRTQTPLTIDGNLNDKAWRSAPWTRDFVDIEGAAKPRPIFRTRAKMLWDDQYFYIGAELQEPDVWGTLTRHDAVIFQDNDFELFIDPDGDTHNYYEFEMNALNTGWDLLLKKRYIDGGPAVDAWEIPGLKTAVHVRGSLNHPGDRDRGWSVEIALPWTVLREFSKQSAPPLEGEQWRVDFSRVEWMTEIVEGKYRKVPGRKEENWVWSPTGIIDMHRPEKWGYVQFAREGKAKFQTDPDAAVRDRLQEIYYWQRDFKTKNNRWAASLDELGTREVAGGAEKTDLKLTPEGFEATAASQSPLYSGKRWHIRQDNLIWLDQTNRPGTDR